MRQKLLREVLLRDALAKVE